MSWQYLKHFSFLIAVLFIFSGCAKDDNAPECPVVSELLATAVLPVGSGTVSYQVLRIVTEEQSTPDHIAIELSATPVNGYTFKHWIIEWRGDTNEDPRNPLFSRLLCSPPEFTTYTAVFDKVNE